jgi:mono/diheme cytochrome c family protein
MHRDVFDATCANCHTTDNPGGTDNTSFCSNSACHGSVWEYAGFDAPALREILLSQMPPVTTPEPVPDGTPLTYDAIIQPLFEVRCGTCHGDTPMAGLNLITYETTLAGSENGPVIIPGDPEQSMLVQVQSSEQRHFGPLSPEELALVIEWIASGAPE